MNRIRRIVVLLAGLTVTVLASAPAVFAMQVPPPGELGGDPVKHAQIIPAPTHTVVVGGMPGWQITLIAAGAALTAAVLAVLLDRMLAAMNLAPAAPRPGANPPDTR